MKLSEDRVAHMHGVAEYMYEHSYEYGLDPMIMFYIGFVHDIGYIYGNYNHESNGAQLACGTTREGFIVSCHGMSPQEYMETYNVSDDKIPKELILLWEADMSIDALGNPTSFADRLHGIANRYGAQSDEFRKCKAKCEWLKNRRKSCVTTPTIYSK